MDGRPGYQEEVSIFTAQEYQLQEADRNSGMSLLIPKEVKKCFTCKNPELLS